MPLHNNIINWERFREGDCGPFRFYLISYLFHDKLDTEKDLKGKEWRKPWTEADTVFLSVFVLLPR